LSQEVRYISGLIDIRRYAFGDAVVVYVKPRGRRWYSGEISDEIASAFDVQRWKVDIIGASKDVEGIVLVFKVEGVRLVE
jgi:hypothetical protein